MADSPYLTGYLSTGAAIPFEATVGELFRYSGPAKSSFKEKYKEDPANIATYTDIDNYYNKLVEDEAKYNPLPTPLPGQQWDLGMQQGYNYANKVRALYRLANQTQAGGSAMIKYFDPGTDFIGPPGAEGSRKVFDLENAYQDVVSAMREAQTKANEKWKVEQQKKAEQEATARATKDLEAKQRFKETSFDTAYNLASGAKDVIASKGKIQGGSAESLFGDVFGKSGAGVAKKGADTGMLQTAGWMSGFIDPTKYAEKTGLTMEERLSPSVSQKLSLFGAPTTTKTGYTPTPFSTNISVNRSEFVIPKSKTSQSQAAQQTTQKRFLPAKTGIGKYV
jgi:hypothetical protein